MAKSDLQYVLAKWNQRAATARQMGLPTSTYQELATKDIKNVLAGHTPMQDAQVGDAILTAAIGHPVIGQKQPNSGIESLPGNFIKDIGDIATSFLPGVAHYAASLPEQFYQLAHLGNPAVQKKLGWEPEGSVGGFIRDLSRVPVLGPLLPGARTAGELTTGAGRKEIMQHPGFATVDVLPYAGKAGELAVAGRAAEDLSATEALAAGSPIKAGLRAGYDTLTKAPPFQRLPSRAVMRSTLGRMGISTDIVNNMSRPFNQIQRGAQRAANRWIQTDFKQLFGELTDPEREQLYEIGAYWSPQNRAEYFALPPRLRAILTNVRDMTDTWAQEAVDRGELAVIPGENGKVEHFAISQPVVSKYRRATRADELLTRAKDRLDQATAAVQARVAKHAGNLGKVRGYLEDPAAFAARAEHPVTLGSIGEAIRPLSERFVHDDPMRVFGQGIRDANFGRQGFTQISKDIKLLEGDRGLFAQLDDYIAKGDLTNARVILRHIKRTFRHPVWGRTPYGNGFLTHIKDLQDEMIGLTSKTRAHGYSGRLLTNAQAKEAAAARRVQTLQNISNARHVDFIESYKTTPPARYHPMLAQKIRENVGNVVAAKKGYTAEEMAMMQRTIAESPRMNELKAMVGDEEYAAIEKDILESWSALAAKGADPIFFANVNRDEFEHLVHPTVLPDKLFTPSVYEHRVFNFGHSMHDIMASVAKYKMELISQEATQRFMDDFVIPRVRIGDEVAKEYEKIIEAGGTGHRRAFDSPIAEAKTLMEKEWEIIKPESGLHRFIPETVNDQQMVIPKQYATALKQMMRQEQIPLKGVYNKTMGLYKFSVLTTPRHLAHVAFGGLTFGVLREPGMVKFIPKAWKIVKDGLDPDELPASMYGLSDDQMFNLAGAKTIGRVVGEAVGSKAKALAHFEEHLAQSYRVAAMLSGEARGMSRDVAIQEAAKIFVDMDSLLPIERVVMKQAFPFYAFTRHLFRYLFTYPVDHPVRAAILTQFARHEQEDWNTGLPQMLQLLFFLGKPDLNGNVKTIDMRTFNPFRSFENTMTIAGITASLNPFIASGLQAIGVNTLSATPELYPEMTVDPNTGSLVAKRKDVGPKILESFIPEVGALEYFLPFSDKMRRLRATNPAAFKHQLYSSIGIPFEPTTQNVALQQQQTEMNRYKTAQQAVSGALQSGDFTDLMQYDRVPTPASLRKIIGSKYATPAQIQAIYNAVRAASTRQGMGNVSVHALLPRG